jgi:predicted DNA-binding transcriptional regulator YafY
LVAWLLSFGDEARFLGPDWVVEKVKGQVARMEKNYEF